METAEKTDQKLSCEYAEKDSRIKYYKRTNHGLSATRNFGIQEATGDYYFFLDSDFFKSEAKSLIGYDGLSEQVLYEMRRTSSLVSIAL